MSITSKLGPGLRRRARHLAVAVLPAPLVYEAWHRRARRHLRTDLPTASHVHRIRIDEHSHIATYWSDVPRVGAGPSASVYVLDEEVLRIDCFGDGRGHMHLNPAQTDLLTNSATRLHFGDGPVAADSDRARFETLHNLRAALDTNALRRVRRYQPDPDELHAAVDAMHRELTALARTRDAGPR